MVDTIRAVFQHHLMSSVAINGVEKEVIEVLKEDWSWVCFHYKNNTWKYDRNFWENVKSKKAISKSSLSGYMYYIYYKMIGVEGISSE